MQEVNTPFSLEIRVALFNRIKERRTQLSSLLQYLHNRYQIQNAEKYSTELFLKLNKSELLKVVAALLQRTEVLEDKNDVSLQNIDEDEAECFTIENEIPARNTTTTENLRQMMDRAIAKQLNIPPAVQNKGNVSMTTRLRREITIFDDEGMRGHYLDIVYESLLTIPPTSVEAERAFSAAGLLCTKIRSRLSDKTIDTLCQLRAYFQKERK